MQIYNTGAPFERIQLDILGPLPVSNAGNKYLLVIIDCFTKLVEAFPLKNIRTRTIAEIFVDQFISRHGVPLELHPDQGRNFESNLFKELIQLLGIKKTRTTALHPQSNRQAERQQRAILDYLAKFVSKKQTVWDYYIPMYLLAYRSLKNEITGVSPAELYFARDLWFPLDLLRKCPFLDEEEGTIDDCISNLREKFGELHLRMRECLETKSRKAKER